ncbi:MAG: chlorophyll synthesis pathway protein BchC [Polynucleobacter sp.]|jgi:3-hydroxyethyl bacteriochlorophyllide a dehydrogenase|nr:chlorophyll synthesis pathway protein BchC [Polynucleobacter sp.]
MTQIHQARAVVLEKPESIVLSELPLSPVTETDVVVEIEWSGISSGTEKLLWNGRMPNFPGMGYPLVPGYESVGKVSQAGLRSGYLPGQTVFVPGARCFGDVKGLFGGAASRLVVPASRVMRVDEKLGNEAVLLALAATAHHVTSGQGNEQPDLIVGHGVLGRLIARIAVLAGKNPVVWETNPNRRNGNFDYEVIDPSADKKRYYKTIVDVSGDASLLDLLISCLSPSGEIVLAGFYDSAMTFSFPQAFMREAKIRIAAQWQPYDLLAVKNLAESGRLSLDGLITHYASPLEADKAYRTAFSDVNCLKMVLDWRTLQ